MCSFRPLGSYLVHLGYNKLMVPQPKGPPSAHTKNTAQASISVFTVNFKCMWEKPNQNKNKPHRILKLEAALQIIQFCSQNFIDQETRPTG